MNEKHTHLFKALILAAVCIFVATAVFVNNSLIATVGVALGLIALLLIRKMQKKHHKVDERIIRIAEKSAYITLRTTIFLLIVLYFSNSFLQLFDTSLTLGVAYILSFMSVCYLVLYYHLQRKM